LAKFGYLADIAADGEEAFEAYRRGHHRLLLVDCHMSKMDGYALTRAIRQREAETGGRLPIVAITADAQQGVVDRCFDAGMDRYPSKPVELEESSAAVNQWLGNGSRSQPGNSAEPDAGSGKPYCAQVLNPAKISRRSGPK